MRAACLISLSLLVVGCSGGTPGGAASPSPTAITWPVDEAIANAPRDLTADEQVNHVLNRLAFGPRPGDVDKVRAMGVDKWIAMQLDPTRIDDARADQFGDRFVAIKGSSSDLMSKYPPPAQVIAQQQRRNGNDLPPSAADSAKVRAMQAGTRELVGEMQAARVARAVLSERQFQEVMTDFWLNHFNVFIGKGPQMRAYLPEYERDVIRPNALGNFRTMLGAVAHSSAMLLYLDNWQSMADSSRTTLAQYGGRGQGPLRAALGQQNRRRGGLNENYGRELLELHTLGVDGGYTQKDVINVARAFTGWSLENPRLGGGFVFRPQMHDADAKVVLGHQLAEGRGEGDGEEVLDIVAAHPKTARYIATKLARRFVSDTPPAALVERAAAMFTRTHGDIRATLHTIVTSPEFFARAAYRSKVKTPFEVVVSAMRALDADGDATPRTAAVIARLGQPLFGHQAPNGWPETGSEWMNTGAILNRINFGTAVAANRIPGVNLMGWPGARELMRAPRDKQVDGVVAQLLGGEVSRETRQILMSGENPFAAKAQEHAATEKMSDNVMVDAPAMAPRKDGTPPPRAGDRMFAQLPVLTGFPQIVGLALGAPEFQRR